MEVAYFSGGNLEELITKIISLDGVVSVEPGFINLQSPTIAKSINNEDTPRLVRGIRVFYWTAVLQYQQLVQCFFDIICKDCDNPAVRADQTTPSIHYVTSQQKAVAMYKYLQFKNNLKQVIQIEQINRFNPLQPELRKPIVLEQIMRAA